MRGILLTVLLISTSASPHPWLKIDQVQLEPSPLASAKLTVFASAITLQGSVIQRKSPWALRSGGQKVPVTTLTSRFNATSVPLSIVFVVDFSENLSDALKTFRDPLGDLLSSLPQQTRIGFVIVGSGATQTRFLSTAKAAAFIDAFDGGNETSGNVLQGVKTARKKLSHTSGRKAIVVLSDGVVPDSSPEDYKQVAAQVAKENVPIHSLAYSHEDYRYSLQGLGTLSNLTQGTFRWVRSASGWESQLRNLANEFNEQYIVHFFLDREHVLNKSLTVSFGAIESEPFRVEQQGCGEDKCSIGYCSKSQCMTVGESSWLQTLLLYGGGGLGGLLVLSFFASLFTSPSTSGEGKKQKTSARVVVHGGPHAGQVYGVKNGTTLGRKGKISLPLDSSLLPKQVQFRKHKQEWRIVAMKGAPAILIRGVRAQQSPIKNGTRFRLGESQFEFRC